MLSKLEYQMRIIYTLILTSVLTSSFLYAQNAPKEEFRGVWIASVANIDFPQSPTTDTELLKEEWLFLVDQFKALNFNALIVQIRPAGDALYPTSYAPWSAYLTGQQGIAPEGDFDFLEFMTQTAHERNMEFHAWLNPYRATMNMRKDLLSPDHQIFIHPEWFEPYGGKYYYNPALPEVQQHITDVVEEIVQNYDIDAIHFDDYFYPYKSGNEEFPDAAEYASLGKNFVTQADFREYSVTRMIEMVSAKIKEIKPYVRFGISPFGVWRNAADDIRGSETRAGVRAYDDLHAHILDWLRRDLIDYVAPQLYWHIGFPAADYEELVNWWSNWNFGKNVYIGHAAYKIGTDKYEPWHLPEEVPDQVEMNRSTARIQGSAYFSSSKMQLNPLGLLDNLDYLYRQPAKLPEIVYLNQPPVVSPQLIHPEVKGKKIKLNWQAYPTATEQPYYYLIYRFRGKEIGDFSDPQNIIGRTPFGTALNSFEDGEVFNGQIYTYAVAAVNRVHSEAKPSLALTVKKKKNKAKVLR